MERDSKGIVRSFTNIFMQFLSLLLIGVLFNIILQDSKISLTYSILLGYVFIVKFMNATSSSRSLLTSIVLPCSCIILSVYFLNSLNIFKLPAMFEISPSFFSSWSSFFYWLELTNLLNFSIKLIKILFISTFALRLAVVSNSCSNDWRWYSSGNAWITHSIKYC